VLKFSKINILITTLLSIIVIFFTISNFTEFEDEFVNKKINLGLDLQGGSYLLLKIDNDPVIIKELQNKAISLRNDLKENEENELSILESYLPDQINEIELEQKINQLKSELFNNEKPNIGILIKNAISKFNSVSDNGTISKICRKILEQ